jgi:hypothetical protein
VLLSRPVSKVPSSRQIIALAENTSSTPGAACGVEVERLRRWCRGCLRIEGSRCGCLLSLFGLGFVGFPVVDGFVVGLLGCWLLSCY